MEKSPQLLKPWSDEGDSSFSGALSPTSDPGSTIFFWVLVWHFHSCTPPLSGGLLEGFIIISFPGFIWFIYFSPSSAYQRPLT